MLFHGTETRCYPPPSWLWLHTSDVIPLVEPYVFGQQKSTHISPYAEFIFAPNTRQAVLQDCGLVTTHWDHPGKLESQTPSFLKASLLVSRWTNGDTTASKLSDGKRMKLGMAGPALNRSSREGEERESCMGTRLGYFTSSSRKTFKTTTKEIMSFLCAWEGHRHMSHLVYAYRTPAVNPLEKSVFLVT